MKIYWRNGQIVVEVYETIVNPLYTFISATCGTKMNVCEKCGAHYTGFHVCKLVTPSQQQIDCTQR